MKKIFQSTVIRKILASYIILLIVPILCFSLIINDFYNRYVVENVKKEQTALANRTTDELAKLFASIQQINKDVKLQKMFFLEYSSEMPVAFIDIRDYLQKSETLLHFNVSIYYCDLTKDEIHTSNGLYHEIPLIDELMLENRTIKKPTSILLNNRINYITPIEHSQNGILLSAMIFSLPNSYFASMLEYASFYPETVNTIFFEDSIIYTDGKEDFTPSESRFHQISSNVVDGFSIRHDIPKSEIQRNTIYPLKVLGICILAMLLLGIIVVLYMLKKNYLPIQNIMVRLLLEANASEDTSDMSFLDTTVTRILNHKQSLMTNNVKISNEYILYRILTSPIEKESSDIDRGQLQLLGPCFLCILLCGDATLLLSQQHLTVETLRLDRETNCAVLSGSSLVLAEIITQLTEHQLLGEDSHVGIGTVVSSTSKLHESFIRAKFAHSEAIRLKKSAIELHDDAVSSSFCFPYELMDSLGEACMAGDLKQITYFTQLLKSAVLETPNRFLAICIFEDYLQTTALSLESLQLTNFQVRTLRDEYYRKISGKRELLSDSMSEILLKVSEHLTARKTTDRPTVNVGIIKSYIQQNYLRPDFSIKLMSFEFKTSPSNLSHMFKKDTGITLTEYMDQQRNEYAKSLLAYSERSIGEISSALGYANASTFIRKFKAYENVTPGEYRNAYKEKTE